MTTRSTDSTVTFARPFRLTAFDGAQPAGTYRLVVDEEEILGLSFVAYRRTATMLHIPDVANTSPSRQSLLVDHAELSAALEKDRLS